MADTATEGKLQHREVAAWIAAGKDLVALLRDAALLLMALLLIGWPGAFNSMLEKAGFEEGSFAGLKWKKKLSESDAALVSAQATIVELRQQNAALTATLGEAKNEVVDAGTAAEITRLQAINRQVADTSASVQRSVQGALAGNAPLVQKLEQSAGDGAQWGVVFGGDRTLAEAQHEIARAAKQGLAGARLYLRQGYYRSVLPATDRLQAEQLLARARELRADAYLVDLARWCPAASAHESYQECGGG